MYTLLQSHGFHRYLLRYLFKIGITISTVSILFLNRDLKTSTDKKYEDQEKKCFVVHQNIYLKSN